jgi:hypothetical protein
VDRHTQPLDHVAQAPGDRRLGPVWQKSINRAVALATVIPAVAVAAGARWLPDATH